MHKLLVVIRREFIERVRTKWFIIGTIFGPILMATIVVLPMLTADQGARTRTVVVLDATTDGLGVRLTSLLQQTGSLDVAREAVPLAELHDRAAERARLVGGKGPLDGIFLLTDAAAAAGQAEYQGSNVSSLTDMRVLLTALRTTVFTERLSREGVDPAVVGRAQIPVDLATVKIQNGKVTGESGKSSFFFAYATWFLLYIAILVYGVQVLGAVVEEKSTRIVEVLVSSLNPFHLMAGKVIGVGLVGLLQMGIWLGAGKLLVDHRVEVARLLGQGDGVAQVIGNMSLPTIPVATVGVLLIYFLLGYFLYAAMFAAVAAMVNTETEARQAQVPVTMLLVVPSMLMIGILNNPDGQMALTFSLIPFTSPIGMPVRWAAAPVPLPHLAASIAILIATVAGIMWIAGRIYRVGILAYGKRPGLRDIVRWVRG